MVDRFLTRKCDDSPYTVRFARLLMPCKCLRELEARVRIELTYKGFADRARVSALIGAGLLGCGKSMRWRSQAPIGTNLSMQVVATISATVFWPSNFLRKSWSRAWARDGLFWAKPDTIQAAISNAPFCFC